MTDLDLLQFELLKSEIQTKYLENNTASEDEISKWKGIDIVYFQEDLRKETKETISEKTFYSYFKTKPVEKLPRIDILNLLSRYLGYESWYAYKKKHENLGEVLTRENDSIPEMPENAGKEPEVIQKTVEKVIAPAPLAETPMEKIEKGGGGRLSQAKTEPTAKPFYLKVKPAAWAGISAVLVGLLTLVFFDDALFSKTYTFHFIDADRGQSVQNTVEVLVLKENESPIRYRIDPNKDFVYKTRDKVIRMVISSIFYQTDTIVRNLKSALPKEEIELKPNEYSMMLYSYSTTKDFKKRRAELERLISENAIIYQVFDNKYFNVETMTKQRYIDFLSLPTTSLENLDVIETRIKNNKIVLIKFRIKMVDNDEE